MSTGAPGWAICPYELASAGEAWWSWAWGTAQSRRWDPGALYMIARRATLEDDLAAREQFDPHSLDWFFSSLEIADEDSVQRSMRELGRVIGRLQSLATAKVAILKEMRELEMHLGLGPKALAGLGWKADEKPKGSKLDELRARRESRAGGATA